MIEYRTGENPDAEEICELYRSAGLPRPVDDPERIAAMYAASQIVITARSEGRLVGAARSISDGVWCAYLADLAVDPGFQRSGIGRRLVEMTREAAGELTMVLLLSVPDAIEYYPKLGMQRRDDAFFFPRSR
jgi:predicted N-acetyltransferase YhbS